MASAKVMPNSVASSRKQGHLALGKKKLEEFRKKKAAKQIASSGQLQSAETDQYENQINQYENSSKNSQFKRDDYSSGIDGIDPTKTSGMMTPNEDKAVVSSQDNDLNSSIVTSVASWNQENHSTKGNSVQEIVKEKASRLPENSSFSDLANGYYDNWREKNELRGNEESKVESTDGLKADQHIITGPDITKPYIDGNNSNLGFYLHNIQSGNVENRNSPTNHMQSMNASGSSNINIHPEKSESISAKYTLGHLSTLTSRYDVEHPLQTSSIDNHGNASAGGRIADAISRRLNVDNSSWHARESSSLGSSFGSGSSSSAVSLPSTGYGITFGRSRPSFLDSLGVSRVSSLSNIPHGNPDSIATPVSSSKFDNTEAQQPSADNFIDQSLGLTTPDSTRDNQLNALVSLNEKQMKQGAIDQNIQRDNEFPSFKKDEEFASLEQHIEDLTRENFSLKRALETAQTLSQSLAAENSSLTDSFNQQGKVVNQLKSDMESLQGEIKAQMLALESIKMEYANAQLECNAADERAKLLASEVISLEEKALRLRSNELKLEKQLENLNSEIASYKRKVSVLEKERQDFQSTVDALQEEKKVLQSKLRKASTDGKTKDLIEHSSIKQDASTSTDDLVVRDGETSIQGTTPNNVINATQDVGPSAAKSDEMSKSSFLLDDRRMDLPVLDACGDIPQDQLRMIENITALISELAVEKEELVQALRIESSNCSKLKELNKDLSQKLEAQTQRLELLTAQRMANENVLAKPIDAHSRHDATQYADEGDEVVERVLGWIMKLFPGGPAKRRTSKLL
ncbi:hypothetical protein Cni_G23959 [Canna indica]|uniref:BLISTER n=1 Tax=Canna indica TaxID=4628 RepID=A0AAQ3QMQ1_9LILI|nr:hypothetical protein Cni_G23959 [Canna indica]